eukprot:TRINITY_DN9610_c0_g2_i2.p1 TRINITY_DN9610_c0_g2~~TRINITY_DN9610_c0_g2_i2.p1  ORF type:complete len:397 (+),score=92.13 TRINITY_DN9610_c0_g2_i2:326-1516(+)
MRDVLGKKYAGREEQVIGGEEAVLQFKAYARMNAESYQPMLRSGKYKRFTQIQRVILEKKVMEKEKNLLNKEPLPTASITKASTKNAVPVELASSKIFNESHSFGNCEKELENLSFSSDEYNVYSPQFESESEVTDEVFLSKLKADLIKFKAPIPKNNLQKKMKRSQLESSSYTQKNIASSLSKSGGKSNNLKFTESNATSSSIIGKGIRVRLEKLGLSKKSHKYLLVKSLANCGLLKNGIGKRSESSGIASKTLLKRGAEKVEVIKLPKTKTTAQLQGVSQIMARRNLSKSSLVSKDEAKNKEAVRIPLRLSNKAIMGKLFCEKDSSSSSRGACEEATRRECGKGWETFRKAGSKRSLITLGRALKCPGEYNSNEDFTHKTVSYTHLTLPTICSV